MSVDTQSILLMPREVNQHTWEALSRVCFQTERLAADEMLALFKMPENKADYPCLPLGRDELSVIAHIRSAKHLEYSDLAGTVHGGHITYFSFVVGQKSACRK